MAALKNHKVACVIMVVLMVLSLLLGSGRSLRGLTRSAEDIFFNGARGDGASIFYDMRSNLGIAYNMEKVAGRYLDEKDSALKDLDSSIVKMEKAETIQEMADANDAITKSIQTLSEKLVVREDLSDTDRTYCSGFVADVIENNKRIPKDPYNQAAIQANQALKTFPASLLRLPAGVKMMIVFSQ